MLHKATVGVIAILACITVVQHVLSRIQPPSSQVALKHSEFRHFFMLESQSTVPQHTSLRHFSQSEPQSPSPQMKESDMPQPVFQVSAVISRSMAPSTEEVDSRISSLNSTYEAPSREKALSPQFPAIVIPYVHPPYEPPLQGEYDPPIHGQAVQVNGKTQINSIKSGFITGSLLRSWEWVPSRLRMQVKYSFKDRQRNPHQAKGYVALCLAIKDQHNDIMEWLEWHRALGVDRIYVIDSSEKPLKATIAPYIDTGLVEYHHVDRRVMQRHKLAPQLQTYDTCLQSFRHRHAWLGFIDSDEFIVLHNRTIDLPTFLEEYETVGALAMNWVVFGSSGHVTRPKGGVLMNYRRCLAPDAYDSRHVKLLVNTRFGDRPMRDPHTFRYSNGKFAVNELFEREDGAIHRRHTSEKIALHHYVTKSLQDYNEKMNRGSAMGNHKTIEFFDAIDLEAEQRGINCTAAVDQAAEAADN